MSGLSFPKHLQFRENLALSAVLGGAQQPVAGLPIQDESGNNILDENNLTITG